jgi:hypothetical protein
MRVGTRSRVARAQDPVDRAAHISGRSGGSARRYAAQRDFGARVLSDFAYGGAAAVYRLALPTNKGARSHRCVVRRAGSQLLAEDHEQRCDERLPRPTTPTYSTLAALVLVGGSAPNASERRAPQSRRADVRDSTLASRLCLLLRSGDPDQQGVVHGRGGPAGAFRRSRRSQRRRPRLRQTVS